MTIIGLKELRQNASEIAERAKNGEHFTVVKRSKAVFTISPPQQSNQEIKQWTSQAINRYRPALKNLEKK